MKIPFLVATVILGCLCSETAVAAEKFDGYWNSVESDYTSIAFLGKMKNGKVKIEYCFKKECVSRMAIGDLTKLEIVFPPSNNLPRRKLILTKQEANYFGEFLFGVTPNGELAEDGKRAETTFVPQKK